MVFIAFCIFKVLGKNLLNDGENIFFVGEYNIQIFYFTFEAEDFEKRIQEVKRIT